MGPRIAIKKLAPEAHQHLYALDGFLKQSSLDPVVRELVKIRASQMNGCAFCVDMHAFAAHEAGESLERLFAVAVWREAPFFTDAERAALALTEAATVFEHGQVPDEVWTRPRPTSTRTSSPHSWWPSASSTCGTGSRSPPRWWPDPDASPPRPRRDRVPSWLTYRSSPPCSNK